MTRRHPVSFCDANPEIPVFGGAQGRETAKLLEDGRVEKHARHRDVITQKKELEKHIAFVQILNVALNFWKITPFADIESIGIHERGSGRGRTLQLQLEL